MADDLALLPDEWHAYFSGLVDRLREHAIEVVDALDADIELRTVLIGTDLPEARSIDWDDLLAAQPTELDRADLQAKFNRALAPVLPKEHTR